MHGIIYNLFFKFVRENFGDDALLTIQTKTGTERRFYDATKSHPDGELMSMLNEACTMLKISRSDALEAFGGFLAPNLLKTYGSYVDKSWGCMEMIEHVEKTMHRVVRNANPDATPPKLRISRPGPNEVRIEYTSERKMEDLGIGIIKAISSHYNEPVSIEKQAIADGTLIIVKKL